MEEISLTREMSRAEKRKHINNIKKELTEIVERELSEDELKVAQKLIEEIAFMQVTLATLKYDILKTGAVYLFKQGKQEMYVEHPSSKQYNSMITKYNALLNNLMNMLPRTESNKEDNLLASFMATQG